MGSKAAAAKAVATKQSRAIANSARAKKAWRTMRKNAAALDIKRSNAANKAWKTRRG